jgi:hypothetical protein
MITLAIIVLENVITVTLVTDNVIVVQLVTLVGIVLNVMKDAMLALYVTVAMKIYVPTLVKAV